MQAPLSFPYSLSQYYSFTHSGFHFCHPCLHSLASYLTLSLSLPFFSLPFSNTDFTPASHSLSLSLTLSLFSFSLLSLSQTRISLFVLFRMSFIISSLLFPCFITSILSPFYLVSFVNLNSTVFIFFLSLRPVSFSLSSHPVFFFFSSSSVILPLCCLS